MRGRARAVRSGPSGPGPTAPVPAARRAPTSFRSRPVGRAGAMMADDAAPVRGRRPGATG
ncbi:hypothetical protein CAG99_05505 [Streptomyces marincola]|uniref:Uncharacterized protein n=1 Tax=Streptomyces marincola TaxID=2878388 RepID=A0A1W7CU74_9ACTN|nr:hypothetical protein CAG99_05505 [Streptomyces marincola]